MFEALLPIIVGIITIGFTWSVFYNDEALDVYMKHSYKAKLWIKLLGSPEKARWFMKKVLAPFGIVLGAILIVVGILFFVI